MILAKTLDEARASRHKGVLHNGCVYWRSDFFGSPSGPKEEPQGFLVEQSPSSVVPPHFHQEDEFQVVVRGTGRLGRNFLQPLTVHYTDAYTGYGPIYADGEGLCYFTLRARHDPGARFLPESRSLQKKVPRRHLLSGETASPQEAGLQNLEGTRLEEVLAPQEDGLAAWKVRMGPGAADSLPDPKRSGGRYLVVINGSLTHGNTSLPRWSCLFISSGEAPVNLSAGRQGLDALLLQFPRLR